MLTKKAMCLNKGSHAPIFSVTLENLATVDNFSVPSEDLVVLGCTFEIPLCIVVMSIRMQLKETNCQCGCSGHGDQMPAYAYM